MRGNSLSWSHKPREPRDHYRPFDNIHLLIDRRVDINKYLEDFLCSPEPTSQWVKGADLQFGSENIENCVGLIATAGSFHIRKVAKDLAALKQKCQDNSPNTQTAQYAHLVTSLGIKRSISWQIAPLSSLFLGEEDHQLTGQAEISSWLPNNTSLEWCGVARLARYNLYSLTTEASLRLCLKEILDI